MSRLALERVSKLRTAAIGAAARRSAPSFGLEKATLFQHPPDAQPTAPGPRNRQSGVLRHALVLLFFSLLLPAQTKAQSDSEGSGERTVELGPDERSPRERFDAAMRHLEAGEFADAILHFEASLAAAPRPATAYNLAIARRGVGDPRGAQDLCAAMLEGRYGDLDPQGRREVEALRDGLGMRIAHVSLHLSPSAPRGEGEAITLTVGDDAPLSLILPATALLRLNPGPHEVRIDGEGITAATHRIIPEAGPSTMAFEVALSPLPARLEVQCDAPDAVIEIEGVASGRGQLNRELPAGTYRLLLRTPHGERTQELTLAEGELRRLSLSAPDGPRSRAWLWITGAVVLSAGAAGLIYWGTTREGEPRRSDDFPHIQALRF